MGREHTPVYHLYPVKSCLMSWLILADVAQLSDVGTVMATWPGLVFSLLARQLGDVKGIFLGLIMKLP